MICVWYDAEGRDPGWTLEEFEKIKSGRWTYRGYSTHLINAHIEVSINSLPILPVEEVNSQVTVDLLSWLPHLTTSLIPTLVLASLLITLHAPVSV